MPKTGIATLPLHYGKAPQWLFRRMSLLAREIMIAMVNEFGRKYCLRKLSDPYWFQALGCILGFDWHSSGITTTVTGALKEGLKGLESELGIFIAGGKGSVSRKTPEHILHYSNIHSIDPDPFIYASRMSAKVDNAAVQDGYTLYHHVFIFTPSDGWAVIQQGMNQTDRTARRYHWFSETVNNFLIEPHSAICCDKKAPTLNLTSPESSATKNVCAELSRKNPEKTVRELSRMQNLMLTKRHHIETSDIQPEKLHRILLTTYARQPENFERLLSMKGVGPKTIRALSLVAELLYDSAPSYCDPARFSFAHGGKDGIPYPVDRETYDRTIDVLRKAIESSKIGNNEQMKAIKRLSGYFVDI
jgi:hypothetical protein